MAVVPVLFTRRSRVASGIYNAGEKAAFEAEVAEGLIRSGAATRLDLSKIEPKKSAEQRA